MDGKWIWIDHELSTNQKMVLFTKTITLQDLPTTCSLELCADSRYWLCVNGKRVMTGPCRAPQDVWYMDRVDVAPYLVQGENRIDVSVVQYYTHPEYDIAFWTGPTSITTKGVGALLIRELETELGFATSKEWQCCEDKGYLFKKELFTGYVGFMEYIDAALTEAGLSWQAAVEREFYPWALWPYYDTKPRNIPYPYMKRDLFKNTMYTEGFDGLTVPAGGTGILELDAGCLVNAYPHFTFTCGAGSVVKITYAEGYGNPGPDGYPLKGVRDQREGQGAYGFQDVYIAKAGTQMYSPFLFRTFRIVKIEVTASSDAPFALEQPDFTKTGYPLEVAARFESEQQDYNDIWTISERTLRRCMYETYMDCPYFEHMQYLMDTFLEMRYTLAISHDARLVEKGILDFEGSQFANGFMPCNAPSKFRQMIPGFPFYYPLMLDTYRLYVGDQKFLRGRLGGLEKLLAFYETYVGENDLLGDMGFWQFFDWVKEWNRGCPTEAGEIHVLYNMLYVYALRCAASVNRFCDRDDVAAEYEALAERIALAVRKHAYNEELGLFSDMPGKMPVSQHAQIFAVVSGVMPKEGQRGLMERMIARRDSLAKPSYCFSYFLCRALEQTGLYEHVHKTFGLWDVFIGLRDLHLTTWPEDFVTMRSDCHGWSSVALYEFTACYLGVQPIESGYRKVRIRPLPCPLSSFQGRVPVGKYGEVFVKVWTEEDGQRRVQVRIPEGLPCEVAPGIEILN